MIIDIHCHLWDQSIIGANAPEEEKKEATNLSAELLLEQMNQAKIDKTVLLALDSSMSYDWFKDYKEYNNYIASVFNKYPDRFIGFLGIDLRREKDAITELERCIELDFKGVKLWPLTGFYVDDQKYYTFYEKVREYEIPILCHIGAGPTGTYLKYNRPTFIDTVAVDFPEITFILPHLGEPWRDEALSLARKNPNVYLDISWWAAFYHQRPMYLIETLAKAKFYCGLEKILFGSDWPLFLDMMSLKNWVDAVKTMETPEILIQLDYPEIKKDEISMILRKNAEQILKL